MALSFKKKLAHYTAVARGEIPVKKGSKFTESEQRAYARGQRDARNEVRRVTAYKNASLAEREQFAAQKAVERERYKAKKYAISDLLTQAERSLSNVERNIKRR